MPRGRSAALQGNRTFTLIAPMPSKVPCVEPRRGGIGEPRATPWVPGTRGVSPEGATPNTPILIPSHVPGASLS